MFDSAPASLSGFCKILFVKIDYAEFPVRHITAHKGSIIRVVHKSERLTFFCLYHTAGPAARNVYRRFVSTSVHFLLATFSHQKKF